MIRVNPQYPNDLHITPTLYDGTRVLKATGSGIRIRALEEDDNSPTSGADVVSLESIISGQEGFTNCILQTTYRVMEPIHANQPLESSEESDTCLEFHPSLSQES